MRTSRANASGCRSPGKLSTEYTGTPAASASAARAPRSSRQQIAREDDVLVRVGGALLEDDRVRRHALLHRERPHRLRFGKAVEISGREQQARRKARFVRLDGVLHPLFGAAARLPRFADAAA